jgi:glycerol-3-phosphate dehydrogenase
VLPSPLGHIPHSFFSETTPQKSPYASLSPGPEKLAHREVDKRRPSGNLAIMTSKTDSQSSTKAPERSLEKMADRHFDVLIIGGGISGATVAWDASLRGLRVALVERGDFNCGTSSASSKLVHGGLRYLANGEFRLVRESLSERRIWERIAPHMVDPLPFLVPIYDSKRNKRIMQIGLTLYDILSLDRRWLKDPAKRLPRHRWLRKEDALKRAPDLTQEGLLGALMYYDCQMYSPERIGLECILGAADRGAHVANHMEVTSFLRKNGSITGATVKDLITGVSADISADVTVNATGPWADFVLKTAQGNSASKHLLRSKGIHIIVHELSPTTALALQAGGDHIFVLPWRGKTLIGTTDTTFRDHPDNVGPTEGDIEYLLGKLNTALPKAHIKRSDVIHAYAGLRPLIDTDGDPTNNDTQETYSASRKAEIVDHEAEDGLEGLISALGGKWTTSRNVAARVVDMVLEKLPVTQKPAPTATTATTPIFYGDTGIFSQFLAKIKADHPQWDEESIEHLAKIYGTRANEVLALAEETGLKNQLSQDQPTIEAEVLFAVRKEMGMTLSDVLFRRTELGTLGAPSQSTLQRLSQLLADELGWDEEETSRQVQKALKRYEIKDSEVS